MYFTIRQSYTDYTASIYLVSDGEFSLSLGQKLPDDIPLPLRYEIDMDDFGPDPDDIGGEEGEDVRQSPLMPTTFLPDPLFRADFLLALQQAGVANIDSYPVVISNPETGEENHDYVAANIIGLIACADLGQSQSEELAESHVFRKLVIDPKRTRGADFFRLAECSVEILVSERILKALPLQRFPDVVLKPVEETG